jgi:hypothetical protein
MSHTLSQSGVFMGEPLNVSGDLLPPDAMYEACRVMAREVAWKGDLTWDFSTLETIPIPDTFKEFIHSYLTSVLNSTATHKGWKIPETTLVFPWIRRMFPEMKYIFWIRDPRDSIVGSHVTDDMTKFGIPYPPTNDERLRRAISWKYQYDLVKATIKPRQWIEIRFEDFVLNQEPTIQRLENFLGIPLARIPVKPEAVGRWETDTGTNYFDFFAPAMVEYGYELPKLVNKGA